MKQNGPQGQKLYTDISSQYTYKMMFKDPQLLKDQKHPDSDFPPD